MSKKKSNIYHRKDGRWEGRFYIKEARKYKSVYGKTYSEAIQKLESIKTENAPKLVKCKLHFNDIVKDWLENIVIKIKKSSYYCYLNKIENHILPYFKNNLYSSVNLDTINEFIKEKFGQKLSAKYISDMVVLIKSITKWANKVYGYENKLSNVQLPRIIKKEPLLLNSDEQTKLIKYLSEHKSNTSMGIILTLSTGIRIGELCALKWEDIDFENKIMTINKSVQRTKDTSLSDKKKTMVRISSPKTSSSIRKIPLPEFLIKILKEYRKDNNCYLISGKTNITEPRTLTNRFKSILKKAKLSSIKFHSLRHIFATKCIQKNFDIKTLSEILGHSNVSTTMQIYIHSSIERKRVCMNMFEACI